MGIDRRFLAPLLLSMAFSSALAGQAPGPDLRDLLWGLENRGETRQILIDHYTSGMISGIPGEDIRRLPPSGSGREVIVAVLDTGVDAGHPALRNALKLPGFNAITGTSDIRDQHGHGTLISGIIAGRPTGDGFEGVSSHARILPVKVVQTGPNAPIRPQDLSGGSGTALTRNVARGILWAVDQGAEILQLSLAWPSTIRSKEVEDAVQYARSKNVLLVTSAGNDSTQARVFPCLYEDSICVGAHGPDGAFTHFSNFGPMVDLLAPGISILSSWPGSKTPVTYAGGVGYEFRNGTSMAAPFVSGALAELLSTGMSPGEARARILLGSRTTRSKSLFRSEIKENFARKDGANLKSSAFGNLDLSGAMAVSPRPFLAPLDKTGLELEWNGADPFLQGEIRIKNLWKDSGPVRIRWNGKSLQLKKVMAGEILKLPVSIPVAGGMEHEHSLWIRVESGDYSPLDFQIPVRITRILNPLDPAGTQVDDSSPADALRSVIASDSISRFDWLKLKEGPGALSALLFQDSIRAANFEFQGLTADQLLNLYRLPDGHYAFLFQIQNPGDSRPSFRFQRTDSSLNLESPILLGTDLTMLPENFKWMNLHGRPEPLWISLGFTPKQDLPPYDPWNPKATDLKSPKIFYLDHDALRVVKLENGELPLQILPDLRILTASGNSYFQTYQILTLTDGVVRKREPLEDESYRMLIGLSSGITPLPLDGTKSGALVLSGGSIPGSLRTSSVGGGSTSICPSLNRILSRTSPTDSLVSIFGAFTGEGSSAFFAESHFDLLYYSSKSEGVLSSSLNRYSYIPSMIFSRNFYPVVVTGGIPPENQAAIYIPATLANGMTSEIRIADEDQNRIRSPLQYRIRAPASCQGFGNLVSASPLASAKQMFLCGNRLIAIPILRIKGSD